MERLPLVFHGNVAGGDAFRGNIGVPVARPQKLHNMQLIG
jgi:hypothetical protein